MCVQTLLKYYFCVREKERERERERENDRREDTHLPLDMEIDEHIHISIERLVDRKILTGLAGICNIKIYTFV